MILRGDLSLLLKVIFDKTPSWIFLLYYNREPSEKSNDPFSAFAFYYLYFFQKDRNAIQLRKYWTMRFPAFWGFTIAADDRS